LFNVIEISEFYVYSYFFALNSKILESSFIKPHLRVIFKTIKIHVLVEFLLTVGFRVVLLSVWTWRLFAFLFLNFSFFIFVVQLLHFNHNLIHLFFLEVIAILTQFKSSFDEDIIVNHVKLRGCIDMFSLLSDFFLLDEALFNL